MSSVYPHTQSVRLVTFALCGAGPFTSVDSSGTSDLLKA